MDKGEITLQHKEWANGTDWKIARVCNSRLRPKFIRFTGVETYGDGGQENKFMSAAEIRVKLAEDEPVVPEPKADRTCNPESADEDNLYRR